jgi:hypothetical protein
MEEAKEAANGGQKSKLRQVRLRVPHAQRQFHKTKTDGEPYRQAETPG